MKKLTVELVGYRISANIADPSLDAFINHCDMAARQLSSLAGDGRLHLDEIVMRDVGLIHGTVVPMSVLRQDRPG